ncbi:MAG: 50S ribosomal protein L9 [Clostridiales bacterium GWB2_37_7]|nr:MAG: 50S ribosomal protein L9 [Clostridiales bacterium GWB2_37_7]
MKVILLQDVKDLGKKDAIVNVSDGYARNFLFPRKAAVEASEGALKTIADKKSSEANKKNMEVQAAKDLADKLSKIEINIKSKTGDNGKLFGSITNKDIAEIIKSKHKIEIDKKKIVLNDAIKTVGIYQAEIKVYPEISAKVKIIISAE